MSPHPRTCTSATSTRRWRPTRRLGYSGTHEPQNLGAALAACLFLSSGLPAQSLSLLVLSKQDHTLAIVDPSTLQVVAKAPVGEDPHEVIASSDGSTAYVSNYGFGLYNNLYVIDLATAKDLPQIDLGPLRGPHGLTFVGGKTWFTAEAAKAIGRYDPATKKVDWIMGTGQNRTHMIFVSDDQKLIVTSNVSSGTVSIFEMQSTRQGGPGPAGAGRGRMGLGREGRRRGKVGQGGQRPDRDRVDRREGRDLREVRSRRLTGTRRWFRWGADRRGSMCRRTGRRCGWRMRRTRPSR
jgi:hypothetical protein